MLLSTFIPKGIIRRRCGTVVQLQAGCLRAGSFFAPHISCLCLSQRLPLAEHPTNALSRAGEILLPVGYLPHFFLREAQHVIRFHFDRDRCSVCLQRVRNLVCEHWQIRT